MTLQDRTILHIDMDAFFASVEQRDRPELRGQPVIIGGLAERGVVSTCSYEARRYGVRSAMPTKEAQRLCPHGIYLVPDHSKYSAVSRQIFAIFARYTPLIEGLSLDEAFLDVTGSRRLFGDGITIATRIKREIQQELDLTASVGVSFNKFLAKLASDLDKPDGLVVLTRDNYLARIHPLPITRLWGVGKKSAEQLQRLGLHTIGDVAQMEVERMRSYLGSLADHIYLLAHGRDDRPVSPEREAKSIGQETTFVTDITDRLFLEATLLGQIESVARRLRQSGVEARTITLKLRYAPFRTITRSRTFDQPTALEPILYAAVKDLLRHCEIGDSHAVRLIGVAGSSFVPAGTRSAPVEQAEQLSLFGTPAPAAPAAKTTDPKLQDLARTVDQLKDKFGDQIVTRARLLKRDDT